jgi:hypothetical protein
MFRVMTDATADPAQLPWRKRHPVISRTLLYGLGLGLAALLVVLLTDRKADDERTRIAALQAELDGLSLVLATDPTGDAVLGQLDAKFGEPGLPVITQGRALRWRAMAWRRKASVAQTEALRTEAHEQVERALGACEALALTPDERVALQLEWAEARLEREDVDGAAAILPAATDLTTVPSALLFTLLRSRIVQIREGKAAGAALVLRALDGLETPLSDEQEAYAGGRTWTAAEVAVELAYSLLGRAEPPQAIRAWNRLRAAAARMFFVQAAAAHGLTMLGAQDDALSAWRAAKSIDSRLAAAEARDKPELQRLERISDAR